MSGKAIPVEVRAQAEEIVDRINREVMRRRAAPSSGWHKGRRRNPIDPQFLHAPAKVGDVRRPRWCAMAARRLAAMDDDVARSHDAS